MVQEEKPIYVVPSNPRSVKVQPLENRPSCELVKTIVYSSAEEFLKDISYGGEIYSKLNNSKVFRGLQSGVYDLVPSALRHRIKFTNMDGTEYIEPEDAPIKMAESEETQRFKEYYNLRRFFELSDSNNLRLPDVDRIRRCLFSFNDLGSAKRLTDEWIPYDLQELAALAQHYGMETRLLDWTSSLETAIYCAVHQEPSLTEDELKQDDAKYMIVWMLDTSVGHKVSSLKFIRSPYYGNPNLAAQKGLFTCWVEPGFNLSSNVISEEEYSEIMKVRVNRKPLDQRLKEELMNEWLGRSYMWKLKIPREGRKELYDYINRKGINAASLFPGYGGVVKCIKEANGF